MWKYKHKWLPSDDVHVAWDETDVFGNACTPRVSFAVCSRTPLLARIVECCPTKSNERKNHAEAKP